MNDSIFKSYDLNKKNKQIKLVEVGKMIQQQLFQKQISLNDLIGQLRTLFNSQEVNIDQVIRLMKSCQLNPDDWSHLVKFDDQNKFDR